MDRKIDLDILRVTSALVTVRAVEEARKAADITGLFLAAAREFLTAIANLSEVAFALASGDPRTALDILKQKINNASLLDLAGIVFSLSSLQQAADDFARAVEGPAYEETLKKIYQEVASGGVVEEYFAGRLGSGVLWIRPPEAVRARGVKTLLRRPEHVKSLMNASIERLLRELESGDFDSEMMRAAADKLALAANIISDSKTKQVVAVLSDDVELSLGIIAGLDAEFGVLRDAYNKGLGDEMLEVAWEFFASSVDAMTAKVRRKGITGQAALLEFTPVQVTILKSADLAIDGAQIVPKVERNKIRDDFRQKPQEMVFALGDEVSNVWWVAEEALEDVRRLLGLKGECTNLTTPPNQAPAGYGVPYDVVGEGKELLVQVTCGGRDVIVNAGVGLATQYIYRNAFIYLGSWQMVPLSGRTATGTTDWFVGQAFGELTLTPAEMAQHNFLVA